jgi:hypothetical protein
MRQPLVVAGLGALTSAFLQLSLATGGLSLFAYFVQLPIAFTGLTLGAPHAAVASLAAGTLVLVAGGWIAALIFLMVQAAPSVILAHFALLWRQGADARIEWYPVGHAVAAMACYVLAVTAVGLITAEWLSDDLDGLLLATLQAMVTTFSGAALVFADATAPAWLSLLSGLVAASWILMSGINGWLAQQLAERSGMARRPTPPMAAFEVPGYVRWLVVGGGLIALFADGLLLHLAATAAIGALLLYLLQGLAVVHALQAWRGWPRLTLVAFYLTLLVFTWPLVLPIIALGLAEDVTRLRDRMS